MCRVFVVDDHPVMRQGYAFLVNREGDMEICGEASEAREALDKIPAADPELIIVDISLEGMSGIELLKRLQIQYPKVRSLAVSMHAETLYADRAFQAGAWGYIVKNEASSVIVDAIRNIVHGRLYLTERMSKKVLTQYTGGRPLDTRTSPVESLSDRELEAFELLGQGLSTREIAEAMHISPKTVESYRRRMKAKLTIESTSKLMQYAVQWIQNENTV